MPESASSIPRIASSKRSGGYAFLQAVVVIEPLGIDEGGAALAVFGDDLLAMLAANLFAQLRDLRPGFGKGNDAFGGGGHGGLRSVVEPLKIVYRILSN